VERSRDKIQMFVGLKEFYWLFVGFVGEKQTNKYVFLIVFLYINSIKLVLKVRTC